MINIPEVLRLRNLAVAYEMTDFGQYRYRMLENAGHWLGEWFRHMKTKRKKHWPLSAYRELWLNGHELSSDDIKPFYQQGNSDAS